MNARIKAYKRLDRSVMTALTGSNTVLTVFDDLDLTFSHNVFMVPFVEQFQFLASKFTVTNHDLIG